MFQKVTELGKTYCTVDRWSKVPFFRYQEGTHTNLCLIPSRGRENKQIFAQIRATSAHRPRIRVGEAQFCKSIPLNRSLKFCENEKIKDTLLY